MKKSRIVSIILTVSMLLTMNSLAYGAESMLEGAEQPKERITAEDAQTITKRDSSESIDLSTSYQYHYNDIDVFWAMEDIKFVIEQGIMTGLGENTFSPRGHMTRGMFVTALGRLSGEDLSIYENNSFTDVSETAYYAKSVEWANVNKIVIGTGDNKFLPNKLLSREEMAKMMVNFTNSIGYDLPKTQSIVDFEDNNYIKSWAKSAVGDMQQAGIIEGDKNNKFNPKGLATRAEVAAILHRFILLLNETTISVTAES